ncbi:hypothetical protein IVB30_21685 [Bradyrhizobium sp. 200]|uniref:hypothetical protein n=1 Tax=Bradyrhizobium sp. 200 TaxID=2782665 RepID=UPI001FFFDFDA|nr:hypothetical protein [Bradyrhizobium sp. 200]UPJ53689.1 hypothetical protein IVB30_21685 [Bradyrhizobium sp. 200]
MTWSIDQPAELPPSNNQIVPERVFYEFDGPLIFSAKSAFVDTIFFKFGENDENSLYLAAPITDMIIASMLKGDLSVRGALMSDQVWVLELASDLTVERYWTVQGEEFPGNLLPARRTGVGAITSGVPDSFDEATALFALNFQGDKFKRAGMPFGVFRTVIQNAHDAARKILIPALLAGTRSATLDFELTEPKFSSLIVALKQPILDVGRITRRLKTDVQVDVISDAISENSVHFVHDMDEIASSAIKGEITSAVAQEKFSILDQVSDIVPTDENNISELAITSNVKGSRSSVVIGEDTGEKILRARKLAMSSPVTEHGVIIQVNGKQSTFLIQSTRGKEVTCATDAGTFKALRSDGRFNLGHTIRVTGLLSLRQRRDYMLLSQMPTLG